jgi:hypothetical protein
MEAGLVTVMTRWKQFPKTSLSIRMEEVLVK